MKSWLGMVSMLWAGRSEAGRGRQCGVHSSGPSAPTGPQSRPPAPHPPAADWYLLWLRFSTSMFLAFSNSRGHSVSWL